MLLHVIKVVEKLLLVVVESFRFCYKHYKLSNGSFLLVVGICVTCVSAGWTDHWERRIEDQGDSPAIGCVCVHCWPGWRIRGSYHYNSWHQWSDTLCPVSAADEVCICSQTLPFNHFLSPVCLYRLMILFSLTLCAVWNTDYAFIRQG